MNDRRRQRDIHLTLLFCFSTFVVILIGESIALQWEVAPLILIAIGLIIAWVIHVTGKISHYARLWIYLILMMLTFFFYGAHETSLFDLAPVMAIGIAMFMETNEKSLVRICALVYYFTMAYDFIFVVPHPLNLTFLTTTRLLLHLILVFIAERLAERTIRKRVSEKNKMKEKIVQLEEVNQRAEAFLTNMSHELRTPINAVTGITSVMLRNEENIEKRKNILAIQMAGNKLFNQIQDILDYTEIDTNSVVVSEMSYRTQSLINDVIEEQRAVTREKNLELIFDIDSHVPSVLLGDPRKIKKVINHLIDNALKFTTIGGVYVRITALPKVYGINLCIQVSDTGMGIAQDELSKIKERFFQSNGGFTRTNGGLGLGIPIIHGLITSMGGFVQVDSTEGNGTTMSVSIPQKVVDNTPVSEIKNKSHLHVALYIKPDKYEVPEVRDFYNTAVSHMIQELGLSVHRVFEFEELRKLVLAQDLTHLVIAKEEYQENPSFYEKLDESMVVIVVSDDDIQIQPDSKINIVRKPFFTLPIINILNSEKSFELEQFEKESMVCPGVRALVVDDEPMNLMVAEGILKSYQMEIKTATSGAEAVEICQENEFDIIFLDHMMPEMDGVETLRIIRHNQDNYHQPPSIMIVFTANAVSGAREMFLRNGFDDFISKPIENQDLNRLLRRVLPKSSIVYLQKEQLESAYKNQMKMTALVSSDNVEKETKTSHDIPSEDFLQVLEAQGFHTEESLEYCNQDVRFYWELLMQFTSESKNKILNLNRFLQVEDLRDYQILVHSLKSLSRLIGAYTLSDFAKDMEYASKDQDLDYVKEHHDQLLEMYREVVDTILKCLPSSRSSSIEDNHSDSTNISQKQFLAYLEELKRILGTYEANKAQEMISKMGQFKFQGISVAGIIHDIEQNVEDFELDIAYTLVKKMIDQLKKGDVVS